MAALLALPAEAAGHRGGRGFHGGGFNSAYIDRHSGYRHGFDRDRGRFAGGNGSRFNRDYRGYGDYRRDRFGPRPLVSNDFGRGRAGWRHDADRPRRLSSTSGFVIRRGSGTTVLLSDRSDYDFVRNFSGSSDVYRGDGGTYATGFGFGDGNSRRASAVAPRARVIDTARASDPCSHEAGVCVIRP
jgi:hypothetical protein